MFVALYFTNFVWFICKPLNIGLHLISGSHGDILRTNPMLRLVLYWPMRGPQSGDEVSALTAPNNIVLLKFLWDRSYHFVIPWSLVCTAGPGARWGPSVSITGQYSALSGLLQNYEWGYWILEGGTQIGCDAPSWPDWINNWWLHICSHWVARMLSSFCDKSWLLSRLSFMGIYWFPNWGQIQLWS